MKWIAVGALWCAIGVGLGAFGAHGLRNRVAPDELEIWRTGVLYHVLQALGLVLYGLFRDRRPGSSSWPALALFLGSFVFATTLYAMTLGAPRWLGAVTPFGGAGMIAGWIGFACQAWRASRSTR